MTNEELLEDLKQFVDAKVSGTEQRLEQRLGSIEERMATKDDLDRLEQRIDAKFDDVQEAIADTLTKSVEAMDTTKQVEDHERRLHRLEQRAA